VDDASHAPGHPTGTTAALGCFRRALATGKANELGRKKLESLPASIGSLTVGEGLHLNDNKLESLPASFGGLSQC